MLRRVFVASFVVVSQVLPTAGCGPLLSGVTDLLAACARGDAGACRRAGQLHEPSEPGPTDPGRAVALYQRACDLGDGEGCLALGLMRVEELPEQPSGRARAAFRAGCRHGHGQACFFAEDFMAGCRHDHGPSCTFAAERIARRARAASLHRRALGLLLPLCRATPSHIAACHYAGISARALGDRAAARRLQDIGCAARIPRACRELRELTATASSAATP